MFNLSEHYRESNVGMTQCVQAAASVLEALLDIVKENYERSDLVFQYVFIPSLQSFMEL